MFALLLPFLSAGQVNLVRNPGFEDTLRCPSDSTITKAKVWYRPSACGTPDYFYPTMTGNIGCIDQMILFNSWGGGGYGPANNNWGTQFPNTGIAYAGMAVAGGTELMAGKLSDSLQAGKTYAVSFYTSLGETYYSQGAHGLDLISFCFMQDSIVDYDQWTCWSYLGTLHVDAGNQSGNFLTDTLGWTLVQDTFVAEGGERFFVFGNIDTANTQYVNSATGTACYYFFDDFDVHCIDCTSDTSEPPTYPEISVTPSITSGEITLSGNFPDATKFEVYNILGQKVFYDELQTGNQSQTLFLTLADGSYLYRVHAAGTTLKTGKIVVAH